MISHLNERIHVIILLVLCFSPPSDRRQREGQESCPKTYHSDMEDKSEDMEVVKSETGHVMTFAPEKSKQTLRKDQENREHREERRQIRRSAKSLKKDKLAPRFWMGKRVR